MDLEQCARIDRAAGGDEVKLMMHIKISERYKQDYSYSVIIMKGHSILAHSRSNRPPRNFPSLLSDIYCQSIGKIKPLKYYILSRAHVTV